MQLGANNGAVFDHLRRSLSAGCSRELSLARFMWKHRPTFRVEFTTQPSPYASTGICVLGIVTLCNLRWIHGRASPFLQDFESESILSPSAR